MSKKKEQWTWNQRTRGSRKEQKRDQPEIGGTRNRNISKGMGNRRIMQGKEWKMEEKKKDRLQAPKKGGR